jgi:predicted lipoprotein with Yx(FWY)xxD motif
MKRFLAPAIIAVAALAAGGIAIAATGSDDRDDTPTAASAQADDDTSTQDSASSSTPGSPPTVNVIETEGLGAVLTDAGGQVLYAADEEADPDVVCTDACEEFWAPVDAGSGTPTGVAGLTGLDVAERPDGSRQVTHDGRRLYTFTLEGPGEATGDGFSDTFDGQLFTWHAVVVDETTAVGTAPVGGAATEGTTAPGDTDVAGTSTAGDIYDYPDN